MLLTTYAVSLAGGQVLFKLAASAVPKGGGLMHKLVGLALNPAFVLAILLYAVLSLFWVWLLTRIPLSQAYPFVALSFAVTLAAGVIVFGEPATGRLLIGGGLLLAGLLVITG
jgi:drug/metabolite transporter (DMT)-like permease